MEEKMLKIVRILNTDIQGDVKIGNALRKIKGISFMLSNATCLSANVDPSKKVGFITREEIDRIEGFIKELNGSKIPLWMLNRRRDPDTGSDMHLYGNNMDLRKREDINMMRKMRSYKGIRHELGQPVRGQRTRSSFRTQKSVGVTKKREQPKKAAKPAGGK